MKVTIKYLFIGLIIALNFNAAFTQNNSVAYTDLTKLDFFYLGTVMQDPEFACRGNGKDAVFSSNPLCLDGKVLDYSKFNMDSKGILTLVKDKQGTEDAKIIPFYVSIRRNGKIVEDEKMTFLKKECYQINLSDIFPFSKSGDMLIIAPAREEDWKAKRILKLFGGGC
jgi:hypothetical protein